MATRVEVVVEDQKRDLASGTRCQGCALTSDSQYSRVPIDRTPKFSLRHDLRRLGNRQ